MPIPSAVMGHVIGPKGSSVAGFRQATGVHVQVISNPQLPLGKLQIGPGLREAIDACCELVNNKLLEYVARGQGQAQATGIPANIPESLVDGQGNFVKVIPLEVDTAAQLAELQDLGPVYNTPDAITKELRIPQNLMGGIIGPRQMTLSTIRKTAKVRVEITSQPKPGQASEGATGILRVGPAPPHIIARAEELIQIKSEELLGHRPRSMGFAAATGGGVALSCLSLDNGMSFREQLDLLDAKGKANLKGQASLEDEQKRHQRKGRGGKDADIPEGFVQENVDIPKELMGAVIGQQGRGLMALQCKVKEEYGIDCNIKVGANPAKDPHLECGALRVGPVQEDKVLTVVRVIEERINECKAMAVQKGQFGFANSKGLKGYGMDMMKGKGDDHGKSKGKGGFGGFGNNMNGNMMGGNMGGGMMGGTPISKIP